MVQLRGDVRAWLKGYGIDWRPGRPRGLDVVSPELVEVSAPGWRHRRAHLLDGIVGAVEEIEQIQGGKRHSRESRLHNAEGLLRLQRRNRDVLDAADDLALQLKAAGVPGPRPVAVARFAYEDDSGSWLVSGEVTDLDGRTEITSITIEPNPVVWREGEPGLRRATETPSGITSAALRSIRLSQVLATVRRELGEAERWVEAAQEMAPSVPVTRWDQASARALKKSFRSAAPGRSDDFYRAVAIGFLEEQAAGRGVYARLAERLARYRLDGEPIPAETLRTWVRVAEQRGYLTPGTRGRSDRQPGPRLVEEETR